MRPTKLLSAAILTAAVRLCSPAVELACADTLVEVQPNAEQQSEAGELIGLMPTNVPVLIGFSQGTLPAGSALDILNGEQGVYLGNFSVNGSGLRDAIP